MTATPSETNAGNGSNGICRVIDASRSPCDTSNILRRRLEMPMEPKITQIEVFEQFGLKKRRLARLGYLFLPITLGFLISVLLGIGGTAMPWMLGAGILGIILILIFGNMDWSCPACGELFRKSGLRIKFCPYCGVALVDGAVRKALREETKNRAEQPTEGNHH